MVQSNLITIDTAPLALDEAQDLARYESIMERAYHDYGRALRSIRDDPRRLYREYGTFEQYCRVRHHFTDERARLLMNAADVVDRLMETPTMVGVLPENERQIRPLTRLEPEDQPVAWQRAVETAPNGKITAAHVEQTVKHFQHPDSAEAADLSMDEWEDDALDPPPDPIEIPLSSMAVHFTSNTPEWYTPHHIIKRVLQVFGEISLDPCSNAKGEAASVPAGEWYTQADNGLTKPWWGRVYMNPPYGDEIGQWTSRLIQAYDTQEIDEAIALIPGRIDTAWYRPFKERFLCCEVHGRLKFSESKDSAPFPSVVVYLGPDRENFVEYFGDIGTIMQKYEAA